LSHSVADVMLYSPTTLTIAGCHSTNWRKALQVLHMVYVFLGAETVCMGDPSGLAE
jgi:hypothetical protein